MLKLDIQGLSPAEISEALFYHASQYGQVRSVRLSLNGVESGRAAALVVMHSREEEELLAWNLGDQLLDDGGVLLVLKQENLSLPCVSGLLQPRATAPASGAAA